MSVSYAYLIGTIVLALVWFAFFFLRKDLRRQQLLISLCSAPLGPISQVLWFHKDYWQPPYAFPISVAGVQVGIEELLFAFFISGIASVIYQVVFRKTVERKERHILRASIIVATAVGVFIALKHIGFNTVWASTDALFLGTLLMILINRRLFMDSVMSAFLVLALVYPLYWLLFAFFPDAHQIFWVSEGLSGVNVLGAPIEEMTWFVAWAMFAGILYEFYRASNAAFANSQSK
ncbi:hypothetical protein COU18_00995 [Candidatus Kaiserbacteria bacterium CG10_big_fil_rev_8_21_14_0_10_51_14]|uniref:Lycopene cyclase domain-containing protein n=1 Tax=Candidatus Kaiserbacteria bacterium CG10_big_fil_rev_8_21_14_0_10_51_14 TaxID=1974610 RepID=A0A2H0UC89_9BACT|nr:MAG: hypothetical protein COU18_00995 [Candidatus Kaiserbacteria bacterium CG10_big_fil_rev_8_21_14_0_10_51_14]